VGGAAPKEGLLPIKIVLHQPSGELRRIFFILCMTVWRTVDGETRSLGTVLLISLGDGLLIASVLALWALAQLSAARTRLERKDMG
jgi:hypothetical protein